MSIRKIVAIVFVSAFVLILPISFIATNVSVKLDKPEGITDVVMTSLLSDEALPQRIREAVWYQSWYAKEGLDKNQRILLTFIRNEQYVEMFDIIFPCEQRKELVSGMTQSVFSWLDSDETYPTLAVEVSPIIENVSNNTLKMSNWILDYFPLPHSTPAQIEMLEAQQYGPDFAGIVTSYPPNKYRAAVADTLSGLMTVMIADADVPARVDITEKIQAEVGESEIIAAKAQVNKMRNMLSYIWLLPVLLLIIGFAFAVRSLDDLIKWAAWPLFIAGLIGIAIALPISNPFELLQSQFRPPPEGIPAPGVPIILALLTNLLTRIGDPLIWEMLTALVLGFVGLIYSYRSALANLFMRVWRVLQRWFEVKEQELVNN